MKDQNSCPDIFLKAISDAIESLRKADIDGGYKMASKALLLDPDAPEPHNLLGILAELKGDDSAARKHYGAAYALDPTYKPACKNLERLVMFQWGRQSRNFDFGEVETEASAVKGGKQDERNR